MLHISIIAIIPGYPHNPYNGVICNDVIAASGVFTTKELWKYSKGKCIESSQQAHAFKCFSVTTNTEN